MLFREPKFLFWKLTKTTFETLCAHRVLTLQYRALDEINEAAVTKAIVNVMLDHVKSEIVEPAKCPDAD